MNEHYFYLLIDFCCIAVPLLFSFHPKIDFHKEWRYFLPANAVVAIVYIAWDIWFTKQGVWGFNPDYITGVYLSGLPIEEVLFFICIPYACVFTYFVVKKFKLYPSFTERIDLIQALFLITLFIYIIFGWGKMYTMVDTLVAYLVWRSLNRGSEDVKKPFYLMYIVIIPAFLISNGLLTGYGLAEPIVWYDNAENLGVRLLTIPVEDFLYAFGLLGANVLVYERFRKIL